VGPTPIDALLQERPEDALPRLPPTPIKLALIDGGHYVAELGCRTAVFEKGPDAATDREWYDQPFLCRGQYGRDVLLDLRFLGSALKKGAVASIRQSLAQRVKKRLRPAGRSQ
jgi:hypothetical protein